MGWSPLLPLTLSLSPSPSGPCGQGSVADGRGRRGEGIASSSRVGARRWSA